MLRADEAGRYFDWGVIHISLSNLLIIVAMIVVFVAALLVPFPSGAETGEPHDSAGESDAGETS